MDFDPTSTANSAQVALYAMQSQQAICSAAAAPPLTPRLAARANTYARQRPTTYHDLPPEILQRIADHMPLDDIGNLSTVDRRTYHALQERRLAWRCYKRISYANVPDLTSVQWLITEIERIRAEPILRAKPLQELWNPFNIVSNFPEDQSTAAFQQIFESAGRVPKQGSQIQKNMISNIPCFQPQQQSVLYEFAYADAERRRPEQGSIWAALASVRSEFPIDPLQFATEYRAFVSRLPALNPAEQAELIAKLAKLLTEFRPNHYPTATTIAELYETLIQWVQRLPASYRGAPIGALANSIWLLSEEQKSLYYANLWHWTLSLPDHQLGEALRHLPRVMLGSQHAHELSQFEPFIERVPPEQRALVISGLIESTGKDEVRYKQVWQRALSLLDSSIEFIQRMPTEQRVSMMIHLLFQTRSMDQALFKQVWQSTLHALENSDEADVYTIFSDLENWDWLLGRGRREPNQRWEDAKTEILSFVERNRHRFDASTCDNVLQYLEEYNDPQ
jgi:hypothetical protein